MTARISDISASELLESTIFPSLLFLLTTCVICLCFGVATSTFISRKQNKMVDNSLSFESGGVLRAKPTKVPKHVAVIMDGNRRFGRKHHANILQGHRAGGQKLIDFVKWCMEDGVEILTVYAFSTENWNRDPLEVSGLMAVIVQNSESLKFEALKSGIRVNVLTTCDEKLPENVLSSVRELEIATAELKSFTLNVCLSYGARAEIAQTCKKIAISVRDGVISEHDINEKLISANLLTSNSPDPDILIRTSGEFRLSNFLLFQMAYTEMFFINKLWPDITQNDLRDIMHRFADRERRYGE